MNHISIKNYRKVSVLIISVILLFSIYINLEAHGTGASYEETVGEYTVDIGYDPEIVESRSVTRLDFGIVEKESGRGAEFTDVWLRITKDNVVFFAGGIDNATLGGARVTYNFPEPGVYIISARYQNSGDALAELEFELAVLGEKSDGSSIEVVSLNTGIGLLLGLFIGSTLLFVRRSKKREATSSAEV